MKTQIAIITAVCLAIAIPAAVYSESVEDVPKRFAKETLRGLPGVWVIVSKLDKYIIQKGLHHDQIRKDVELRMRSAGIKIFTKSEAAEHPAHPFFYVHLYLKKWDEHFYIFQLNMHLEQSATLWNGVATPTTTWKTAKVGKVESKSIQEVRDIINGIVDDFIADWLTVNPKRMDEQ
jgi:hypothetical protein